MHSHCEHSHHQCQSHHHHSLIGSLVHAQFAIAGVVTHQVVKCLETFTAHLLPNSGDCHSGKGSCAVPPPCWMPKSAGCVASCAAPLKESHLKLVVSNNDYQTHTYNLSAAGEHAPLVNFSETTLTLGPKESKTVLVTFSTPALVNKCHGDHYDLLLWVKGCTQQYLNWQVKVSRCQQWIAESLALLSLSSLEKCCVPTVCVKDTVDYELHWYDHFYFQRGCCS